jgi:CMP-N-acetylneuraminic acid synthetase
MRVLGLVPARSGSKGDERKNIKLLGGKPLLQYTAEAALAARTLTRIVLSTDADEIADVGQRCGLEVPFLRPPELARDETPMLPVVQHALDWLSGQGESFDAVCLLQPTNPFRRPEDIDGCVDLLAASQADSVVTIRPVPDEYNPYWVYFIGDEGSLKLFSGATEPFSRRQVLPSAYYRDGSVYVTRTHVLLTGNSLYGDRMLGYPMAGDRTVNIDNVEDWIEAERLVLTR